MQGILLLSTWRCKEISGGGDFICWLIVTNAFDLRTSKMTGLSPNY